MELKKYKLSDVARVEISGVDKKTVDGETPVKLCNFTNVYHNWAITNDIESSFMVASANSNEIAKFSIKRGQVAFTKDSETRDDIGIPTYIADDFNNVLLGYHCALITPDESKALGTYINAFMHTSFIKKYFENNASGSGQRYTLSIETMENMPLLLPSIEEQRYISKLLSNIDKKIALNRKINQNLEALAKQLYDYWFVQFDFPNEEGNPYKSSGGKMVWNEQLQREIPLNWEVKPLSDISNICRGNIITEAQTKIGDVKVVAAAVTYSYLHDTANRTANVITISSSGANAGYMNFWREPIYASDCITIQCDSDIDTILSYHQLELYRDAIMKKSHGSAQPHVYPSDIECLKFICIPDDLKNKIGVFLISLNKEIAKNTKEIEKLIKQRDELLPLLMNGQVNSDLSFC